MKNFKSGQQITVELAGTKQEAIISSGYRKNSKQVCIEPLNEKFEGQLSFMPTAHISRKEILA